MTVSIMCVNLLFSQIYRIHKYIYVNKLCFVHATLKTLYPYTVFFDICYVYMRTCYNLAFSTPFILLIYDICTNLNFSFRIYELCNVLFCTFDKAGSRRSTVSCWIMHPGLVFFPIAGFESLLNLRHIISLVVYKMCRINKFCVFDRILFFWIFALYLTLTIQFQLLKLSQQA